MMLHYPKDWLQRKFPDGVPDDEPCVIGVDDRSPKETAMRDYIAAKLKHEDGCACTFRAEYSECLSENVIAWPEPLDRCTCPVSEILKAWDAREIRSSELASTLSRILKATPRTLCSDAGAWAVAEQLLAGPLEGE